MAVPLNRRTGTVRGQGNKKLEQARRQGFLLGLKFAYKLTREAKNYQSQKAQKTDKAADSDIQAEFEYGAKTLHALCLKFADEIQKAGLR